MRSHIFGVWNMRITLPSAFEAFINNNHLDENWASTSILHADFFAVRYLRLSMRCTKIAAQPNCDTVYYSKRTSRSERYSLRLDEDINCCGGAPLLQKFEQQLRSLAHRPACAQSYKKISYRFVPWCRDARAGRPLTFYTGAQNLVYRYRTTNTTMLW